MFHIFSYLDFEYTKNILGPVIEYYSDASHVFWEIQYTISIVDLGIVLSELKSIIGKNIEDTKFFASLEAVLKSFPPL